MTLLLPGNPGQMLLGSNLERRLIMAIVMANQFAALVGLGLRALVLPLW